MHWRFRDLSIQRQLTAFGLLASLGSLLVAGAALLAFELRSLSDAMVDELARTASVIAANATVALSFDNAADAREILATLRTQPHVVRGCIFRLGGEPFACYDRDGVDGTPAPLAGADDGHTWADGHLTLALGIVHDAKRLGTIVVRSDTDALHGLVRQYLAVVGLVFFAAAGVAVWLSARLQRFLSAPILRLVDAMSRVSTTERRRLEDAVDLERADEIGLLVRGFNDMLAEIDRRDAELDRTHQELVVTSRHAGMSEVATDVLHNVGNVLNSVNVSCSLVADRLRESKLASLTRVAELLQAHESDLPTFVAESREGKLLPRYVRLLADQLLEERQTMLAEVGALTKNIDHIKVIVSQQQSYARTAGMREMVTVAQIVDDALQLNMTSLTRHKVKAERDFRPVPEICVDRHRVLQIVVNLVSNAIQAMRDDDPTAERRVTIAIAPRDADVVAIVVRDTGIGISAENLTNIFRHGFTTKAQGHGFGLHSAALAAKEMGGTLTAESDGPNTGATFTLELPVRAPSDVEADSQGASA